MEMTSSTGRRWDIALAVGLPLALLLPFLNKAFHIDDPVYLYVAQHLLESPLDFYGFTMNWYGTEQPLFDINQNPPLLSYFLAPFGLLFGWKEWVMHGAMLLPTAAAIYGIYVLAERLGAPPRWATWFAVLNPLFFVSATTVMTDVPMLACWLWAVIFWMRGLDECKARCFVAGGVLIGASFLFKYFGLSLLPLLAVYTLMRQPRRPWPLVYLLIPVVIVVGYELWCYRLYGQGQFLAAFSFAEEYTEVQGKDYLQKAITILAFLGCGALVTMDYAPYRIRLLSWLGAIAVINFLLFILAPSHPNALQSFYSRMAPYLFHFCLICLGMVLVLAVLIEVFRSRSSVDLFLFFWIAGTLIFVCIVNHFVNARVLIPLLPAACILVLRCRNRLPIAHRCIALGASLALSLFIAHADAKLANSARKASGEITSHLEKIAPESRVWFAGHWGFQWYMQAKDAQPLDGQKPDLRRGDIIVSPNNNTNIVKISDALAGFRHRRYFPVAPYASTMSQELGAGFYSDVWGKKPFAYGRVPAEEYKVQFLGDDWDFARP